MKEKWFCKFSSPRLQAYSWRLCQVSLKRILVENRKSSSISVCACLSLENKPKKHIKNSRRSSELKLKDDKNNDNDNYNVDNYNVNINEWNSFGIIAQYLLSFDVKCSEKAYLLTALCYKWNNGIVGKQVTCTNEMLDYTLTKAQWMKYIFHSLQV